MADERALSVCKTFLALGRRCVTILYALDGH
jgi:hypothetical protein